MGRGLWKTYLIRWVPGDGSNGGLDCARGRVDDGLESGGGVLVVGVGGRHGGLVCLFVVEVERVVEEVVW